MKILLNAMILFLPFYGFSQTVKIDKEIQIGQSANASQAGAIRFNGIDFEGFDGTEWHSFTQNNSSNGSGSAIWGQPVLSSLEDQKLNAAIANSSDYFGYSVSVSGNTAVIGTYLDDDAGTDAGCAYIFSKMNGVWTEIAKLTASDAVANHWFGYSVGISGDVVVVGAYRDGGDTGAAYVFEKPMSGWVNMTEDAKLTASDGAGSDKLGFSVDIDGNYVVIGAPEDDDNGLNSGSAYVFERPGGGWSNMTETAKLTSSDGSGSDLFGYSVSISDNTLVIGAHLNDQVSGDAGAAYIFEMPGGGWSNANENAKLIAFDGAGSDWFGYAVAISGDDVIIGAYGDNGNKGSAYIFQKSGANWVSTSTSSKVEAFGSLGTDRFGYSVAIENGTAVVGAPYYDDQSIDQGVAYVIQKNDGVWNHRFGSITLKASDGSTDDRAGWSVSISGGTIFSGAFSSTGFDHGAVYVYSQK